MASDRVEMVFEDGYPLRQRDVVVAQARNDEREAEEHDQENRAPQQEYRQWRVRQPEQVANVFEHRPRQRQRQHRTRPLFFYSSLQIYYRYRFFHLSGPSG